MRHKLILLLGVGTPLLCWFSPLLLLMFGFLVIIVCAKELELSHLRPWSPFLLVLIFSALSQVIVLGLDGAPALLGFAFVDLGHLSDFIESGMPGWAFSCLLLSQYVLIILLGSLLAGRLKYREHFNQGLLLGLSLALLVTAVQIVAWSLGVELSGVFKNQNSFWTGIERLTGTFSDPNSFGVAVALVIPFLWNRAHSALRYESRWRAIGAFSLLLGWIVVGSYSGSRSFFLALILYLLIATWRISKLGFGAVLSAIVGIVLIANLVDLSSIETLPRGIERSLSSVRMERLSESLHSRTVFFKLNNELIATHPLVGVGFGRFRDYVVQLSAQANLQTGLWSDNNNNFYLGLVAECGIVGIILFILALSLLRFRPDAPYWGRDTLWAFLILLLLGPHIEAIEVAILVGWIFGSALGPPAEAARFGSWWSWVPVCFLPLILIKSAMLPAGWSAWEREGETVFRWTTGSARTIVKCEDGAIRFGVRAINPDIGRRPVTVTVSTRSSRQELIFGKPEWSKVEIACKSSEKSKLIVIKPSRVWSPRSRNKRGDPRFFGVQVRMDPKQLAIG